MSGVNIKTGARAEFKAELWRDGKLVPPEDPKEKIVMMKVGDDGVLAIKLIRKDGAE